MHRSPSLKKAGKLHALRRISTLGRITYQVLGFEGDNTVKKEVIARYLTAEAEAQKEQPASLAVTPANYKFKYSGRGQLEGRNVHIFQVTPRQKRQGMYKGELWIDAESYLRVQESGYLVKNPSVFLKRVAFVREYADPGRNLRAPAHPERGGDSSGRQSRADHRLHQFFGRRPRIWAITIANERGRNPAATESQ